MDLDSFIEALLFLEGEPVKIKKLASILGKSEKETEAGLEVLEKKLSGRGIRLIQKDGEATLSTAPEASSACEAASQEEFNKDIGRAGLEVLSIVAYQSPVSRANIDYVRGVNSSFVIRNLLIRGLVERKINPKDNRSYLYRPSLRFLQFIGVSKINDLPEYENFKKSIEQFTEHPENELAK